MALVSLATELIVAITFHIDPDDISNFAATCKRCHGCSQQRLYHTITLHVEKKERTAQTLSKIIGNPRISLYARHLHVKGDASSMGHLSLGRLSLEGVHHLLQQHGSVPPIGDIVSVAPYGQLLAVLLMRLLPRLEYVHLAEGRWDCEKIHQFSPIWGCIPLSQPMFKLTVLKITTCIDPKFLSALLHSTPSVQTFCWEPDTACHADIGVWKVLQDYTHGSLKTLKVQYNDEYHIAPLRDFRVLRHLSLSSELDSIPLWRILPSCVAELHITTGCINGYKRLKSLFNGLDLANFRMLHLILIDASEELNPNPDAEVEWSLANPGLVYDPSDSQLVKEPVEQLKAALLDSGIIQEKTLQLDQAREAGSRTFGVHLPSELCPSRFIGVSLLDI